MSTKICEWAHHTEVCHAMNHTTVSNNRVLLWKQNHNSPTATVARNAQSAWVSGTQIIVQFQNGSTGIFQITPSGTNAYLVRIIH